MKLIITRHGETIFNKNKILQGHLDVELSENGILQAKKLANRFANEKIDIVYSSDLMRAIDTTNEILKFHPKLKLVYDNRIRERYMGSSQGKSYVDFDWNNVPNDFEKNEEFKNRVYDFFLDITTRHRNKTVLLVCHAGTKNMFINIIKKLSSDNHITLKNTSVSEFELNSKGKFEIKYINCSKHLE